MLKDGAKNKGMLKLSTLGSLRECIKLYAETHPNEKEVSLSLHPTRFCPFFFSVKNLFSMDNLNKTIGLFSH